MGSFDRTGAREGFTTGSCAAAAAKASAMLALTGECPDAVQVTAPGGRSFRLDIVRMGGTACGVVKDSGDDPDATNGMTIISDVRLSEGDGEITFSAGEGVGTVTLPGLKVTPGEPAINPVPRRMITDAVRSVVGNRGANVTVSVPGGRDVAAHTFNPRLGVTGGISILGTTGVVRPMDEKALFDSLTLELNTYVAAGLSTIALTFGSTGEECLRRAYGIHGRCVMQTGNYIGYVLDEAVRLKVSRVLLCGHPGKLLKVAAGTFNTHNRTGDGRKEALCAHAALAGFSAELVRRLYEAPTTDEDIKIIRAEGLGAIWTRLAEATAKRCSERSFGSLDVAAAYIDNDSKILGESSEAESFAEELRNDK